MTVEHIIELWHSLYTDVEHFPDADDIVREFNQIIKEAEIDAK